MTSVSVIIPSYNRGAKLRGTIEPLLKSTVVGIEEVEIIVVDDGSPDPLAPVVIQFTAASPFSLRCIRQHNAGPAAARNRGFRESQGEIVLFIDDDIVCPPDLIAKHVDAHRNRPGAVICGCCPLIAHDRQSPLFRFIDLQANGPWKNAEAEFVETSVVASGQLSVERCLFATEGAVYRSDLATPAAEEYELSARLQQRSIPILIATRIAADHDHPLELGNMCRQAFKHAKGCAEAAAKCENVAKLDSVRAIMNSNQPLRNCDSFFVQVRTAIKLLLSTALVRTLMLHTAHCLEKTARSHHLLMHCYRVVLAVHMYAGVREGIQEYGTSLAP